MRWLLVPVVLLCVGATRTTFGPEGTVLVNGRPFFPIGCWVYGVNPEGLADLHEHRFGTGVGDGVDPGDLAVLEKHHLRVIPMATDAWVAAGKKSDALLAWYLTDEPEEHNMT